jgi:hypothetical protein
LAQDVKGVAVATVSYEASTSGWSGRSLSLEERAKSLFPLFKGAASPTGEPIIFVCHSLGGLVLKQLVVTAASGLVFGEAGQAFIKSLGAVAFYATPHGGSRYGDLADKLRFIVWPTPTMQCLSQAGPQVHALNELYRNWAAKTQIRHLILYETHRTLFGWIVKSRDADPGIANAEMQPGEADHFTICKPFDKEDARYTLCRDLVKAVILERSPKVDLTPSATDVPTIPDPLPKLPPKEPVVIPHLILRALILLAVCYVGYRGLISVYQDPFRLRLEQTLAKAGATSAQQSDISKRIIKDLQEKRIGNETFLHFLDRGELQVSADPEALYNNFISLADKYVALEQRASGLSNSSDPEVKSLAGRATTALSEGDIATADLLAKAAEFRQKVASSAKFRRTDANGGIEFLDDWEKNNIVTVNIPQLATVQGGTGNVRFYKGGARQLKAAFDEIQAAGLLDQIHDWCGSYSPRLERRSNVLSTHALGTSFDINCAVMPPGLRIRLSERPRFAKLVEIFQKHGFMWGGLFSTPDPMHFQLFRDNTQQ